MGALQRRGWRVELLSGDEQAAVAAVAAAVGADAAHAEASPEKKLSMVQQSLATATTVLVGDGVNDAAALSAATCGIAVSGSAEVSMEAAGVFLSKQGIAQVASVLDGASRTITTIKRNFRISLFYNVTAGALAASGVIKPLLPHYLCRCHRCRSWPVRWYPKRSRTPHECALCHLAGCVAAQWRRYRSFYLERVGRATRRC